jgi:hypothetical protein
LIFVIKFFCNISKKNKIGYLFFLFFSKIYSEDEFDIKTKFQREDDNEEEEEEFDVESLKKHKVVLKKFEETEGSKE